MIRMSCSTPKTPKNVGGICTPTYSKEGVTNGVTSLFSTTKWWIYFVQHLQVLIVLCTLVFFQHFCSKILILYFDQWWVIFFSNKSAERNQCGSYACRVCDGILYAVNENWMKRESKQQIENEDENFCTPSSSAFDENASSNALMIFNDICWFFDAITTNIVLTKNGYEQYRLIMIYIITALTLVPEITLFSRVNLWSQASNWGKKDTQSLPCSEPRD